MRRPFLSGGFLSEGLLSFTALHQCYKAKEQVLLGTYCRCTTFLIGKSYLVFLPFFPKREESRVCFSKDIKVHFLLLFLPPPFPVFLRAWAEFSAPPRLSPIPPCTEKANPKHIITFVFPTRRNERRCHINQTPLLLLPLLHGSMEGKREAVNFHCAAAENISPVHIFFPLFFHAVSYLCIWLTLVGSQKGG